MSRFHPLTIADVRRETADAVSISFTVPDGLRDAYRFIPGQYLTLRTEIGGEEARRSYSICSGLDDGELRVAVKKVEGGVFSTFANDNLARGMTLDVMIPEGRFLAEPHAEVEGNYVAFAAGSGVTPILAIVKTLLEREPKSEITFFYGNRATDSILFRVALEDLKDRFLERFNLIHVLSREEQDVDLLHGRLDAGRIRKLAEAGLFDPAEVNSYFLCGPGDMIGQAKEALAGLGVAPEKIHSEMFVPADGAAPPRAVSKRARETVQRGVHVETLLDGTRRSFEMLEGDGNVVAAAARQGLELPYSCKGGMCCTCRCKVVEGEVEMALNYSLEPWEMAAGFTLACQARPLTGKLVLDFDEV
jgi:ring-1,2-phenylacetyl-CoA epoxidase subunit PaaE